MNCKPGDLAVVVRARETRNVGLIVKVEGPYPDPATSARYAGQFCWEVSGANFWGINSWLPALAFDSQLRPIRDQDGEDETLTWAGKPADIKEPA